MRSPVVFYSWQSDLPRNITRDVVHQAAIRAISRLSLHLTIEEAPRLDHDTQGESGVPAISDTIFRKIKASAVFLADVSFVDKSDNQDGKKAKRLPNPNVLIELGYAAATIGWERIILVLNQKYGHPESLPFDLRHRRFPLTYSLAVNGDIELQIANLTTGIEDACRVAFSQEYGRVTEVLNKLSSFARNLMTTWGHSPSFFETKQDNVILSRQDLAILQLLEFGVITCEQQATTPNVHYVWTYLGRECIKRLGIVPFADQVRPPLAEVQQQVPLLLHSQMSMPFLDGSVTIEDGTPNPR